MVSLVVESEVTFCVIISFPAVSKIFRVWVSLNILTVIDSWAGFGMTFTAVLLNASSAVLDSVAMLCCSSCSLC